jgi:FtsP/CotA-like multicopper oxidase with cupredoxin domain
MFKKSKRRILSIGALGLVIGILLQARATAQVTVVRAENAVKSSNNPCPRGNAGDFVTDPPALYSQNGTLQVYFSYETSTDSAGRTLYCFMTPAGMQSPTLHVSPGDTLIITVTNNTPATPVMMGIDPPNCGTANVMTGSSMNIHYHGTNTTPRCGGDEVIKTVINSGQTFRYELAFPTNEPPGLYWYHPHVHGIAEAAVQGGASGAIVVDGIENIQPAVAGLPQRVLMIRDQNVPGSPSPGGTVPAWDVSLNYIPIASCQTCSPIFAPSNLVMSSGQNEFWRVVNAAADTIIDLQVQFDGAPQTLQIVGVDGVPVNSQDGTKPGELESVSHFRLPPAARVEFIVSPPGAGVKVAQLVTLRIDNGPFGDNDPQRPLANIRLGGSSLLSTANRGGEGRLGPFRGWTNQHQRFRGLGQAAVTAQRTIYFSEIQPSAFFITVDGAKPQLFNGNAPPSIITTQGSVEEWTIENRTPENHEFHFHQTHFLLESQNNFELNGGQQAPGINGQYLDMAEVHYWDGNPAHPFPSITVRIDFRGPDIGDFVYHCHILGHEDLGMMQIIRVTPPEDSSAAVKSAPHAEPVSHFAAPALR